MEETIMPIKEENKKEGRSNVKLVLYVGLALFLVEIIILVYIKNVVTTFTWLTMIEWLIGYLVVFGGVITLFYLATRDKAKIPEEEKKKSATQPDPITLGEAEDMVKKIMFSPMFCQYLGEPLDTGVVDVGKNIRSSIFKYIAFGKYKDKDGTKPKIVVLINMHYPHIKRRVIINPKTDYEIHKAINELATFPEEEPTTREIHRTNPLLGTEEHIKERIKKSDKEAKEEVVKEKEDLV